MDRYKGCEDGVEMLVKMDKTGSHRKRQLIQIIMMSTFAFLTVSCGTTIEQTKPSQPDLPQPTFTSPSASPSAELTPTPTPAQPTTTPTNAFLTSSTPKPPTPTGISDELSPADLITYKETQEAYARTSLLTPSPTPTLDVLLTENGPWLVNRTNEDLILMNFDGTGLTRMTIDTGPHWDWGSSISTISASGNWLALTTGYRPESNGASPPYNLAILLLQLPPEKFIRKIPVLSPELSLQVKQETNWFQNDFLFPLLNTPMLWSPDGRYLAFVAALDGPSSDLYVYDIAMDQIRRLTDGPNQAWLMGWSPDSQWILHIEATGFLFDHGSTIGQPITTAVWVASPDGNQIKKVRDVDDEIPELQGWLSPTVYVEQMLRYHPPYRYNIREVDIRTGEITSIYPCFGSVMDTTKDEEVVLWSDGFEESWLGSLPHENMCGNPLPSGLYVFRDGNSFPVPQEISRARWDTNLEKFLLSTSKGVEMWDLYGQLTMTFSEEGCVPKVSPDGQWLAFWFPCDEYDQPSQRIRFYDSQGDLLKEVDIELDHFSWHPDSSGIFFKDGDQLWFLPRQDGEPFLIHPDCGIYPPIVVGE
jgi:hypothetical protein